VKDELKLKTIDHRPGQTLGGEGGFPICSQEIEVKLMPALFSRHVDEDGCSVSVVLYQTNYPS
jgi:hypothetical protein